MSHIANQQRNFLQLLAALRPHWRQDTNLPARIQHQLARQRSFGARDRRLYRELIYTTLRYLPWIEPWLDSAPDLASKTTAWLAAETPATSAFRAELTHSWPPCPATVQEKITVLTDILSNKLREPPDGATKSATPALAPPLPEWFRDQCPSVFAPPEIDALLTRASLWLRLQTTQPSDVFEEFTKQGWTWRSSALLPTAIEFQSEADVTKSNSYQRGLIEIQDLGSQLILASAAIVPGETWLDACAGAGGKTLQLATLLGSAGRIDAHDIRPAALAELAERARRAGLSVATVDDRRSAEGSKPGGHRPPLQPQPSLPAATIAIVPAVPAGSLYDGVLVDAPCSGSGTWRRAPHLKWVTTAQDIAQAVREQRRLLDLFCRHVRLGGRLIYATCSLSHEENEDVVAAFLQSHPEFSIEAPAQTFGFAAGSHGLTLLPARHNTDGFFVAALRRT